MTATSNSLERFYSGQAVTTPKKRRKSTVSTVHLFLKHPFPSLDWFAGILRPARRADPMIEEEPLFLGEDPGSELADQRAERRAHLQAHDDEDEEPEKHHVAANLLLQS